MDRRNFLVTLVGISPLSTVYAFAKDHDNGKGKGKKNKHDQQEGVHWQS